jgi:transposase
METYIGFDLHRDYTYASALDREGKIVAKQQRLPNRPEAILGYLSRFERPCVAVEATLNWYWVVDLLQDHEVEVTLTHPKRAKAIVAAKIKSDQLSSRWLAELRRSDLIPACYIPDRGQRTLRDFLRHRASLVVTRTALKNRIHAILRNFNQACPYSDLFGKGGRAWLEAVPLEGHYRTAVTNYLGVIATLEKQLTALDDSIRALAQENPQAQLLDEIPGIDYYSALLIVLEIGDIVRFADHRHFCSYLGIVPCSHRSGTITYTGRITKEGNKWLRWLIVEAAQKASLSEKNPYHAVYRELASRKGASIAKVAVARKIATAIYYMLSRNEPFHPSAVRRSDPSGKPGPRNSL